MYSSISKLKPFSDKKTLNVIIETPQGSRGKYVYDVSVLCCLGCTMTKVCSITLVSAQE